MPKVILSILGTAQDAGIPHPNCYCAHCARGREDSGFARLAASVAIVWPEEKQWHLIDASPDLRDQMTRVQKAYGMEGRLMAGISLTHAHLGHYPGLLFLGREAIGAKGIPVFAGGKMKELLEKSAPWSQLTGLGNIRVEEMVEGVAYKPGPEVIIRPVEVPHRNEFSETWGFRVEGPNRTLLYIPDIDRWDEWDLDVRQEVEKADICLLDATFHSVREIEAMGRDYREIPHPVMTETMERLQGLTEKTAIYFTHFNHSNPAIDSDSAFAKEVRDAGFYIAEDGLELEL